MTTDLEALEKASTNERRCQWRACLEPALLAELHALRNVMATLDGDGGHAQMESTPEQTQGRGYAAIEALRKVVAVARERCDSAVLAWAPELRAALAKVKP